MIGSPTRLEDHSAHGARSWRDYLRVNTDHKVIGVQYLVTTFCFFVIAGLLAMLMRAELAKPGMQYVDTQTYNSLFSVHGTQTTVAGQRGTFVRLAFGDRRCGAAVLAVLSCALGRFCRSAMSASAADGHR